MMELDGEARLILSAVRFGLDCLPEEEESVAVILIDRIEELENLDFLDFDGIDSNKLKRIKISERNFKISQNYPRLPLLIRETLSESPSQESL